ncbi:nucleoside hydrolase [Deinococcus rubellus]|uniref:Nucleoside hydrolase n=1 Tax=Deinococcus rubellus TaxID=1889240 RepID=A0ABY5YLS7_9DEIO|nr:nucleoside hydrolase [Deinococcus rubellus]UWX65214.1 nucleoside hydrolase [Deinococcus rubellus]
MTSSSFPTWHDCDPGSDDAITLLTLLGRSDVQLLGVSTTHGNAPLSATTHNARALLTLAGRDDVPVYAGALAPLVREPVYAPQIHGVGGLGNVPLPEPTRPVQGEHAALALIRQLCAQPGEISVLATGPLTNLALAERLRPGVLREARQIIVMGGSLENGAPRLGNTTPRAEFNTYADPHAFDVVLKAGAKLSLIGLNLTRQVQVTRQRAQQLAAVGTAAAHTCAALLDDYLDRIGKLGQSVGALHDPCTAALMLAPELFGWEAARVVTMTDSGERLGETVRVDGEPNVQLVTRADESGVYGLITEALRQLP